MRIMKTAFVGIILVSFLWVLPSLGADVAKIGIVDFQKILETSLAGKAAQVEISKHGKKMENALKQKQGELQEMKRTMDREALVISREKREEKERAFRINLNDLRTLEKKYKADLGGLNKRLIGNLQDEVFKLVEALGKKEGFLLIMEKREGGVMYSPKAIDITDRLIQAYNHCEPCFGAWKDMLRFRLKFSEGYYTNSD